MRLSTVTMALSVFILLGHFSYTSAAELNPAEATALLAKSQVIDKRCNILDADGRQELQDFTALAEIALAEMQSVQAARGALAKGRALGKAEVCSPEQTKLVTAILIEARKGAAPTRVAGITAEKSIQKPVPAIEPTPVVVSEAVPEPKASPKRASKPLKKALLVKTMALVPSKSDKLEKPAKQPVKLSSYANLVEKYYLARRCNSVSPSALNKLYGSVLSNHKVAVANNSPAAVKAVLRSAEARAGSRRCG